MGSKRFTQEKKLAILKRAAQIGIKEAAPPVGVHYTSVYEWKSTLEALGEEGFLSYKPSMPGGIKKISPRRKKRSFLPENDTRLWVGFR